MSETETKHTPGPWVLLPQSFSPRIYIMREGYGSDDAAVADVRSRYDARLIAAAPDLLEACADVWVHLADSTDPKLCALADVCRAAIAKAEGQS